jgi:hypothetical protein
MQVLGGQGALGSGGAFTPDGASRAPAPRPSRERHREVLAAMRLLGGRQDAQGAWFAGRPSKQSFGFQVQDLLVDGWGGHPKKSRMSVWAGDRPWILV